MASDDDSAEDPGLDDDRQRRLQPGAKVEVRNGFDGSWSRGFTLVAIEPDGYRISRRSDGVELPTRFAPADVRREHRRSMWWV